MSGHRTRLADRLRAALEDEIATGALVQGVRLDETALANRFGVSRTPVREALTALAAAGLVEARPRQGSVVAALPLERLIQMFEVMAELEALCARLATRRMNDADHAELAAAMQACRSTADPARPHDYYNANLRFHEAVYAGSHNAFLADQTRSLRNRLQPYRRTQLTGPGRIATSLAEHAEIVKAIEAGDAIAADSAMRRHVAIQGDTFADLVSSLPDSAETSANKTAGTA